MASENHYPFMIFGLYVKLKSQSTFFGKMKLPLLSLFFFISINCTITNSQGTDDIVTRFLYFNRLFQAEKKGQGTLVQDFLLYFRSIHSLWNLDPAKILSIARNTIYFSFKNFFVQLLAHSRYDSIMFSTGSRKDLKFTFFSFVPSKKSFKHACDVAKFEVAELLKNFAYVEILNDLLMLRINGLIDLVIEFALKINDTKTISDMSVYKFALENFKINYLDETIDYDHFIGTFHEMEFLLRNPIVNEKRLKKLIGLLFCYWQIIYYTSCFKVFELRETASKLMQVIMSSKQNKFISTCKLNNTELDAKLLNLYRQGLSEFCDVKNRINARRKSLSKNDNLSKEARSICDLLESAGDDYGYIYSLIEEPWFYLGKPRGSIKYDKELWAIKLLTFLENYIRNAKSNK